MNDFDDLLDKEESADFFTVLKRIRIEFGSFILVLSLLIFLIGINLDSLRSIPIIYLLILAEVAYQAFRPKFLYDFEWHEGYLQVNLVNIFGAKKQKRISIYTLRKYALRKSLLFNREIIVDGSPLQNYTSIVMISKKANEKLVPRLKNLV